MAIAAAVHIFPSPMQAAERTLAKFQPGELIGFGFIEHGRRLVTAGTTLKIWDVASGHEVAVPFAVTGKPCRLATSADSTMILIGVLHDDSPLTAKLFDYATGHEVDIEQPSRMHCAAISPDGSIVVIVPGYADVFTNRAAYSWNLHTGNSPKRIHLWDPDYAAFTADSRALLTID